MKQDLVHITMHDRREVAFSLYLQTIMRGGGRNPNLLCVTSNHYCIVVSSKSRSWWGVLDI